MCFVKDNNNGVQVHVSSLNYVCSIYTYTHCKLTLICTLIMIHYMQHRTEGHPLQQLTGADFVFCHTSL